MLSTNRIIKLKRPVKEIVVLPAGAGENKSLFTGDDADRPVEVVQISRDEFDAEISFAHEKGKEDGRQEGFQHAENEMAEVQTILTTAIESIEAERQKVLSEFGNKIFELLIQLCAKIVGEIAEGQQNLIEKTLKALLSEIELAGRVKMRLNPEDIASVKKMEATLRHQMPDITELGMKAEETIARGGCIIDTDLGKIDARIETQISELCAQLRKLKTQELSNTTETITSAEAEEQDIEPGTESELADRTTG